MNDLSDSFINFYNLIKQAGLNSKGFQLWVCPDLHYFELEYKSFVTGAAFRLKLSPINTKGILLENDAVIGHQR